MTHGETRGFEPGRVAPRSVWRGGAAPAVCALAVIIAIAGCGESPTPPNEAVQNYLNALGSGNYANACSLLDARATETLLRSKRPHTTCANLFRTCLPHKTLILNADQTQLYYANIQVSVTGSNATAAVSGTAVATELKHVSLRNEQSGWKVTGFGQAIDRCRLSRRAAKRHLARPKPGGH